MSAQPTALLETDRLILTPLTVADATDMVLVLADIELYSFTGGLAPTLDQLAARYGAQVLGSSSPTEQWHNWIIRLRDSNRAIGYVQATVIGTSADVAWVVGLAWQGSGRAREASNSMCGWLRQCGIILLQAHIHPEHHASAAVATACGLTPTDAFDDDGERIWEWRATGPGT